MPNAPKHLVTGPNLAAQPVNPDRCDASGLRLLLEVGYTEILRVGHFKTSIADLAADLEADEAAYAAHQAEEADAGWITLRDPNVVQEATQEAAPKAEGPAIIAGIHGVIEGALAEAEAAAHAAGHPMTSKHDGEGRDVDCSICQASEAEEDAAEARAWEACQYSEAHQTLNEALAALLDFLRRQELASYSDDQAHLAASFAAMKGRRFIRIVKELGNDQRSAFCFIEKATGNVFKPAGWKSPTTKHVRGNIYSKPSAEAYGVTLHGTVYR